MNGHKLVKEHAHTFEIQHPDGSTFHVAKAGLSMPMIVNISKMPRVEHDAEGTDTLDDSDDRGNDMMAGEAPAALQDKMRIAANPDTKEGVREDAPASITTPDPSAAPDAMPVGQQVYPTPSGAPPGAADGQAGAPGSGLPGTMGAAQQDPYASYLAQIQKIAGAQKGAIDQAAAAQSEGMKQQADIENRSQADLQASQALYQQHIGELNDQNDALQKEIAQTKIDPNRLWHNASTGSKIGMVIGMILSGAGAGAGQGNMAMQMINKNIDRDIEAQKSNLDTKQSLLRTNMAKYGQLTTAQDETRLNLLAVTKGQIDAAAAKSGSQVALANAQSAKAQIDMQMAQLKQQIATQRMTYDMFGRGGGAASAAPGAGPDPQRIRAAFNLGWVPKEQQAAVMKDYADYGSMRKSVDAANHAFDLVDRETTPGNLLNPQSRARAEATKEHFATVIDHELAGRVTEESKKGIMANFPSTTDTQETRAVKRQNLIDSLKTHFGTAGQTMRVYGLVDPQDPYLNTTGGDSAAVAGAYK